MIKIVTRKLFLFGFFIIVVFGFVAKAQADITTGLIGLYTFDAGSGTTAADTSGGGHTGTLTNGPTWIAGHIGAGALSFDGVDDVVSTASDFIGTSAGTYSAWINAKSEGENSLGFIITNGGALQFGLGLCNAKTPGLTSNNASNAACSATGSINYNTWYLVTATRNSSGTANIYINGVLSGTANQASGAPQAGTTEVYIGNSAFASRTWDGYIDDVRIYNRALSGADVLELYNSYDTVPPVISSVASSTTNTTATITWTTNENATSTVNYGLTSGYGTASTSASSVTSHSITLTGLTQSTLYHFQVSSTDPSGNNATSTDYTFTTTAPDVTPPIISSIASSTAATSATITWTTNENATSTVNYGATSSYGTASSSSSFVTSHSIVITGLTPSTLYHFNVSSGDASNNNAVSTDYTFTTTPPTPHYIRAGATGSNDGSSWANAWTSFSAVTWTRGNVYYVAGGTYTENVTISAAETGATQIIIKKANASDNSSDAGWNSTYATTQAVVQGDVTINNSYVTIDGVTGSSMSGHGIKINQNSGSGGNAIVNFADGKSFLTLSHIELEGPHMGYANGISGFKQNTTSGTSKGLHLSNLYFHDLSQNGFVFVNAAGTSFSDYGLLFENNVLSDNGYNLAGAHGQGIQCGSGAGASTQSYWIVRNSIIHNNVGTADFACLGFSSNDHMDIYNNIFYNVNQSFDSSGNWIDYLTLNDASSPGVIYFSDTSQAADRVRIYNNTFYNIARNTIYFGDTSTNNEVVNNLFMRGYFNQVHNGVTGSYDDYYNNAPIISSGIYGVPYGEVGQQGESSSPVVNAAGGDFRLVAGANAIGHGQNLSSVFTTDIVGNTRSSWDIGAYEYVAPTTYTIGGTISGLAGTVVLQNNGGDNISTTTNGSFVFATATTTGSSYTVTVLTQPSGQTCSVTSGGGTVAGANVANVLVTCTTNVVVSSGGGGGGATYPSISAVTSTTTQTTALITWKTDYSTTGEVDYGTSTVYGLVKTDSTATTTHSILLNNLIPATTYQFKVKATLYGITSTSNNYSFSTLTASGQTVTPAPTPTPSPSLTSAPSSSLLLPLSSGTRLVNDSGTFYLIQNGLLQGVTSPGILFSYGFEFKDAVPATASDLALPQGGLLLPADGALVKSIQDKTVYLIAGGQRRAFISARIFTGLGFKFSNVLLVTNPELQALPKGADIVSSTTAHTSGINISYKGTVYYISNNIRHPYPSTAVYNSWNIDNDFSRVIPANTADLKLPIGTPIDMRVTE